MIIQRKPKQNKYIFYRARSKIIKDGYEKNHTHFEITKMINNQLGSDSVDIFIVRNLISHSGDGRKRVKTKGTLIDEKRKELLKRLSRLEAMKKNNTTTFKIELIGIALLDLQRCGRCDEEVWGEIMRDE